MSKSKKPPVKSDRFNSHDVYIRLFLRNVAKVQNLQQSSVTFFFANIVPLIQMGNKVYLTGRVIHEIHLSSHISESRVKQLVYECVDNWLLLKTGSCSYLANPRIVFRGSKGTRDLLIQEIEKGSIKILNNHKNKNQITLTKSELER